MSSFSSQFFSLWTDVAVRPFVDENKWWAHSRLYCTWFEGLPFIPHITHIIFARCPSWKHSSPFYFRTPFMSHSPSHSVSRCVNSSIKGKVMSADAFHFLILCKWCEYNCLPSVPRSGNSLHEASPIEPAPEQKWLQQRMPVAQHLGNWGFTFILFQNNFLEGWIGQRDCSALHKTSLLTHPVCYLKGHCRNWTNSWKCRKKKSKRKLIGFDNFSDLNWLWEGSGKQE